jgi:hypothetical protein
MPVIGSGSPGSLSRLRERAGVRVSAGARPVGLKPIEDAQPHRLTLHQHLAVGEAQHVIAELVQFSRAPGVGSHALRAEMLTPIEFDDQHCLDASEVGEVPAHRMLSPELVATDLPIAQGLPQRTLGVGRGLAQLARPVGGGGHRLGPHPSPLPQGEGMNGGGGVRLPLPEGKGIKGVASVAEVGSGSLSRLRERVGVRAWLTAISLTLALSQREREPESLSQRETGLGSLSRLRERAGVRVFENTAANTQRLNCEPACRSTACP